MDEKDIKIAELQARVTELEDAVVKQAALLVQEKDKKQEAERQEVFRSLGEAGESGPQERAAVSGRSKTKLMILYAVLVVCLGLAVTFTVLIVRDIQSDRQAQQFYDSLFDNLDFN